MEALLNIRKFHNVTVALWISYLYHFASYHPIYFFLSCLAPQSIFRLLRDSGV